MGQRLIVGLAGLWVIAFGILFQSCSQAAASGVCRNVRRGGDPHQCYEIAMRGIRLVVIVAVLTQVWLLWARPASRAVRIGFQSLVVVGIVLWLLTMISLV